MTPSWIEADWPAPDGIVAGTTLRGGEDSLPAEPQWLNQVHGARVVHWGSDDFSTATPDADAIISTTSGSICAIRTADCLPILLCARDGSEFAAVHGGWRGLAAGIVNATLDEMQTAPAELIAWIGPAISQPAFEVGHEVREAFGQWGTRDGLFEDNARGRLQADLPGLAAAMLKQRGVAVTNSGLCTFNDPERFYSYRRDGSTGRLLSFVYKGVRAQGL